MLSDDFQNMSLKDKDDEVLSTGSLNASDDEKKEVVEEVKPEPVPEPKIIKKVVKKVKKPA